MVVFDLDTAVDSYPEGLTASFPDLLEDNGHDARRFEGYKSRSSRRRRTTRKNVGNKGKKEEKSNLQIKGIVEKKQESPVVKSKKETPTDDTSRTGTGSSNGDMEVSQYVQYIKKESSGDSFTSEFTPSGEGSSCSEETTEAEVLLAKTQERMLYQRTVEENEELKSRIKRKNEEIEVLAGQLRRATETKCDLVLLQSEMELHHEQDLDLKESEVRELEKANLDMQELRAEVERVRELIESVMLLGLSSQSD